MANVKIKYYYIQVKGVNLRKLNEELIMSAIMKSGDLHCGIIILFLFTEGKYLLSGSKYFACSKIRLSSHLFLGPPTFFLPTGLYHMSIFMLYVLIISTCKLLHYTQYYCISIHFVNPCS